MLIWSFMLGLMCSLVVRCKAATPYGSTHLSRACAVCVSILLGPNLVFVLLPFD